MKTIKYLLAAALMIGFSATSMAQDVKSQVDAISKVITANKNNPDAVKDQVKEFIKANKKNAEALVGLGRTYLDLKDTANAKKYADMAIKVDKKNGAGYILQGDIEVIKDNGGAASGWYENATYFDPKNPEGYRKFATINSKTSPSSSVAKLEELRRQRPDYPVDIISAEIYDKAGNINKALEYYNKVDKSKMKDNELVNYALNYFLNGNFDKSLEISQYGNQNFPKNPALNRISFFNLTNLKKYTEALDYADRLFNKSDSTKITESDYLYYGYAYLGNKDYDKAIDMFNKSLAENKDNKADMNDALKNIASAYQAKGDFTNAIPAYKKYLEGLEKMTAYDLGNLASMYSDMSESATGASKADAIKNADSVYADISDKFPNVADFATYQRARIAFAQDPEVKNGAAVSICQKLIDLINAKQTKVDNDNTRLVTAYSYLGFYYFHINNKAKAKENFAKVLEIDPTNEQAKEVIKVLK